MIILIDLSTFGTRHLELFVEKITTDEEPHLSSSTSLKEGMKKTKPEFRLLAGETEKAFYMRAQVSSK